MSSTPIASSWSADSTRPPSGMLSSAATCATTIWFDRRAQPSPGRAWPSSRTDRSRGTSGRAQHKRPGVRPVPNRNESAAAFAPEPSDFEVESEDFGADLSDFSRHAALARLGRAAKRFRMWRFRSSTISRPSPRSDVTRTERLRARPPGGWLWAEEIEEEDEDFDEAIEEADRQCRGGGPRDSRRRISEAAMPARSAETKNV